MRNICCSRKPDLVKPQGSGQDKLSEMVWVLAGQRSEWAVQNSQHEELNPSKQDRLSDGVVWNYTVGLGFFHPFQPLLPDLISKQPNPQTAPTVSSLPSFTRQYFANISHPLGVRFYNFSKKIFFFCCVFWTYPCQQEEPLHYSIDQWADGSVPPWFPTVLCHRKLLRTSPAAQPLLLGPAKDHLKTRLFRNILKNHIFNELRCFKVNYIPVSGKNTGAEVVENTPALKFFPTGWKETHWE